LLVLKIQEFEIPFVRIGTPFVAIITFMKKWTRYTYIYLEYWGKDFFIGNFDNSGLSGQENENKRMWWSV